MTDSESTKDAKPFPKDVGRRACIYTCHTYLGTEYGLQRKAQSSLRGLVPLSAHVQSIIPMIDLVQPSITRVKHT